jgi:hypothetical protein
MYYTSESGNVKRFDVCQDKQLSNFNAAADSLGDVCYGLRIRPNGEVLVACDLNVLRLGSDGAIKQRYVPADIDSSSGGLFALNLDNDGNHFFTATYQEGRIWRIDIDSGDGTTTPYLTTTIAGDSIGGLAVFGEITVAVTNAQTSRPEIVAGVPDPTEISTDPGVVGTNIVLAIVATIVILLSSQIFNETIEENNDEIEGWIKRYVRPFAAPFKGMRSAWRSALTGNPRVSSIAAIGVVLGATGVVYGFLEPGFKLNKDGILLLISVIAALAAITYAYSGMEARVTERRYNLASGVRVYPVAFLIAVASVGVSRLVNFQPGIIYGFVASNVVLGAGELDRRQKGQAVFIAALCLLATFGLAWAVMIPAREWAEHDANVLSVIFESSSTLIVVCAIESLTFSLVPLEFTHGIKIYRYNRALWFALALASAFLFWHVLIVQKNAGFDAIGKQGTIGALAALGVCVGLTAAVWGFFYYRHKQPAKAEAVAPVSAPEVAPMEPAAGSEPPPAPEQDAESPEEPSSTPAEPAPGGEPPQPLTRDP